MRKAAGLALLLACASSGYNGAYTEITAYAVNATGRSPGGVQYDDPKHEVPPERWDILVNTVEARLAALVAQRRAAGIARPERWSDAEVALMQCLNYEIPTTVRRDWFAFKIAPDWHWSACNATPTAAHQVFPCKVDPALCAAKPELRGCTEPCQCRAMVQGPKYVVTAPNLELAPGEMLRLVTACSAVWKGPLVEVSRPIFPLTAPPTAPVVP